MMPAQRLIVLAMMELIMTQTFTYFTSNQAPTYLPGSAFLIAAAFTFIALLIFVVQIRKLPKESLAKPGS